MRSPFDALPEPGLGPTLPNVPGDASRSAQVELMRRLARLASYPQNNGMHFPLERVELVGVELLSGPRCTLEFKMRSHGPVNKNATLRYRQPTRTLGASIAPKATPHFLF